MLFSISVNPTGHYKMIRKLLIANRSEIACRIMKTAHHLGIETIAIYSDIDKHSLMVNNANTAYALGGTSAQQSYLNREKIIEIAKISGADAIHPGYGFLAEDATFAALCEANHLLFVGPSAKSIKMMGDKCEAKKFMQLAGMPVVPGYSGENQDEKILQKEADLIGFPLLIKATAGGGGKGMHIVEHASQFLPALEQAKREAKSSFDDSRVFLEKLIVPARHVEVQIFCDRYGHGIYLFDRDCSLQRRHQKIIEEAPAPTLSLAVRKKMGDIAVAAAKSINYIGAGTMEFLVDQDESFYFMEMNTRLQVEHPVTEMVTGVDLVQWQLLIASGDPLPLKQNELRQHGHAFEARIYAENPSHEFLPSIGTLVYFQMPTESEDVRVDTGVKQGDWISPYYDPMIAKLIVHAKDREAALKKLVTALEQIAIVGVETNVSFLHHIVQQPSFANKTVYTNLIDNDFKNWHPELLLTDPIYCFIALHFFSSQQAELQLNKLNSEDQCSPWYSRDHWQLHGSSAQNIAVWHENQKLILKFFSLEGKHDVNVNNRKIHFFGSIIDHRATITLNEENFSAVVVAADDILHIIFKGNHFKINYKDPANKVKESSSSSVKQLVTTIPGTIVDILVSKGQHVKKGERLLVLEAMKMENTLVATDDGMIEEIHFKKGDYIEEAAEIITFTKTNND